MAYLSPTEEVGPAPVAIQAGSFTDFDGSTEPIPLVTYGNFVFVAAPPKTMKTFFACLCVKAFYGEAGKLKGKDRKGDLIFFDTEQSKYHCSRVQHRIKKISPDTNGFRMFCLRPFSVQQRVEFIDRYLEQNHEKIGMIIIDGIADLLADNNDIHGSNDVVQKLMYWTGAYGIALMTIIHTNHGSTKPTGHIGSFLEKKAETQIALEKEDESTIRVTCKRSRNMPFVPFMFRVERGLPYIVDTDEDFGWIN